MNAKRTPGPWRVLDSDKLQVVRDIAGHTAAVAIASRRSVVMRDEAEANAQFIVKAVNAHAELVAALEAFVTQATKLSGFPAAYDPYSGALVAARAALSRAKGEA